MLPIIGWCEPDSAILLDDVNLNKMYKPGQLITLDDCVWRIQKFEETENMLHPCERCGNACNNYDFAWHFCKGSLPLNYHLKLVTTLKKT